MPPFNSAGPTTRSRSQGCAVANTAASHECNERDEDQELQQEPPVNLAPRNQRRRTRSDSRGRPGAAADQRQRNEERGQQLQQLPDDDLLQEGGHGAAVARHLGGGQQDHRVEQLQRGDNRLEQEPHAVHQGDPAIPQAQNNQQQQVAQNVGLHEPEAADAQYEDVLPHNNIVS